MAASALAYLAGLLVSAAVVALVLSLDTPPITRLMVAATTPWMATGGVLHFFHQIDAYPPLLAPLFGRYAVYLLVATIAGFSLVLTYQICQVTESITDLPPYFAAMGLGTTLIPLLTAVWLTGSIDLAAVLWLVLWPVIAGLTAGVAYLLLTFVYPDPAFYTGVVGGLAIYGHVLDGITTGVALNVVGPEFHTALSSRLVPYAATLPAAAYVPPGWQFAAAKLLLAIAVTVAVANRARDHPAPVYLLLGLFTAVGLGPGVHDLLAITLAPP